MLVISLIDGILGSAALCGSTRGVCVCVCVCVCGRGAHVLACNLLGSIQVNTKNFRSVGNCPEFRTEYLQTRSRTVFQSTASLP